MEKIPMSELLEGGKIGLPGETIVVDSLLFHF